MICIYSLFYLVCLIALIYGYILFLQVAKRAIKALDIYLKEHSGPEETK